MRVGEEASYAQDRALKLARSGYVVLLETTEDIPTPEPVLDESVSGAVPEKEDIDDNEPEKQDFTPFPEKAEQPKRRGRKPKQ